MCLGRAQSRVVAMATEVRQASGTQQIKSPGTASLVLTSSLLVSHAGPAVAAASCFIFYPALQGRVTQSAWSSL